MKPAVPLERATAIIGGYQSDFATNWAKTQRCWRQEFSHGVTQALAASGVAADQLASVHVGNFIGELAMGQGQLGGVLAEAIPELRGKPITRYEAACASGTLALLGGIKDIQLGHDLVLVAGIEHMRHLPGEQITKHLGAAALVGQEAREAKHPWPHMFNRIIATYQDRFGIADEDLREIAEMHIQNAQANPLAQTRDWRFSPASFTSDPQANPVIDGRIRRWDCGQITDGVAAVILASPQGLAQLTSSPPKAMITGTGLTTAAIRLATKLQNPGPKHLFPYLRQAITAAWQQAGITATQQLSGIELHDCFGITAYTIIDHLDLAAPGEAYRPIRDGLIHSDGALPINLSGGLIGCGHPVGATGMRMAFDIYKQLTGQATGLALAKPERMAMINIGGSFTTSGVVVINAAS